MSFICFLNGKVDKIVLVECNYCGPTTEPYLYSEVISFFILRSYMCQYLCVSEFSLQLCRHTFHLPAQCLPTVRIPAGLSSSLPSVGVVPL